MKLIYCAECGTLLSPADVEGVCETCAYGTLRDPNGSIRELDFRESPVTMMGFAVYPDHEDAEENDGD